MMKDRELPVTTAVRALRAAKVPFVPYLYEYVDHGGTKHAAQSLGVDEHAVVKTLVMESRDAGRTKRFLVLMHGDCEVSTKQLARLLDVKAVHPSSEADVDKTTGYLPGGVSPFGTRTPFAVSMEETITALDRIYINGGKRGFLVEVSPQDVIRVLHPVLIKVALDRRS